MPEFIEKSFKTLLNKHKAIDPWFWCRYTINPYNGCLIACTYCDSRSIKYHMPKDFENEIIIKTNANQTLQTQISRSRSLPRDVVVIGGTTDGYQAAEKKYRTTREILKVLHKYRFPIHIITKSDLILEDLDLLKKISKETWCSVSVTITSSDAKNSQFLEKRAISPEKRFQLVKTLRANGINSGVLMIPLVPFINDNDDQLKEIIQKTRDLDASYFLFGGGLTLRDSQAVHFLKNLKNDFPDILKAYENLYRFTYTPEKYDGLYTTPTQYVSEKTNLLLSLCRQFDLPFRIPRYIPKDHRAINYSIAEKLLNEAYLLQLNGQAWKNHSSAGHKLHDLRENVFDIFNRNELKFIGGISTQEQQLIENYLTKNSL